MNPFDIYSLFPTSLMTFNYDNHNDFKKFFFEYLKNNQEKIIDSNYGESLKHIDNTPNTNFLNSIRDYPDFEYFLLNSCMFYINEIIGNEVEELIITDCWINICDKNGYQPFHNHANSYISGTYYLNYDSEKHSQLKVNNPSAFKDYGTPFIELNAKKYTPFNGKELTCDFIKEGMLVLWPSNLVHGYSKNKEDNRISISMNFMPKKIITGPYSFTVNS